MNTPSPLVPQGSLLEQSRGKSNIRIAVFAILAVHAFLLSGLLMLGCKREVQQTSSVPEETNTVSYFPPYTNDLPPVVPIRPPEPATQATQITHVPVEPPQQEFSPPPVEFASPQEMREYTIASGDNFTTIANKHGITVQAIEEANPGLDPRRLRPGQKLVLPPGDAPGAQTARNGVAPESPSAAANGNIAIYTVKPGDNLTRIAQAHGTTLARLKALNRLSTDAIRAGQKLKVPAGKSVATNNAAPSTKVN